MSEEVSVEATGETVGEAKWAALRELEQLAPGIDRDAVRFQVVTEGERGLLGVGYTPARVVATGSRRADGRGSRRGRRRGRSRASCSTDARDARRRASVRRRRDRRRNHRDRLGNRPRRPDRAPRADDRRAQYLANAIAHRAVADERRRIVVDAAGYRARRGATLETLARRAPSRHPHRTPGRARADERRRAQDRPRGAEGRPRGRDGERGRRAEPLCGRRAAPSATSACRCPTSVAPAPRERPRPLARGSPRDAGADGDPRPRGGAPRPARGCAARGLALVRSRGRPDRRRRLGRRHARDPARGAFPTGRSRCSSRNAASATSSSDGRRSSPTCASSGGAEEQPPETFGVAVAKALAEPRSPPSGACRSFAKVGCRAVGRPGGRARRVAAVARPHRRRALRTRAGLLVLIRKVGPHAAAGFPRAGQGR